MQNAWVSPQACISQLGQKTIGRGKAFGKGSLLSWCWHHDSIVVPLTRLPKSVAKMDGLVANIDGRPVIVISKKQKQPAWLAFILAHELGHIQLGHTQNVTAVMDDDFESQYLKN